MTRLVNHLKPKTIIAYHLLIIAVLGGLIYSNALTGTFQFDDKLNIVDNFLIRDIRNFWPPSGARWFGLLTFSLNYLAGGLNPFGYHLVNICIHILTAVSVYLFVLLTFRTPYFKGLRDSVSSDVWLAFACALLFVSHPIQTQAVTYIVQRFASLATLLFMMSVDCYVMARLRGINDGNYSQSGRFRSIWLNVLLYAAACLFALLSLKTKEIAYTLLVVAVIYDLMFISRLSRAVATIRNRWVCMVSLAGAGAAVAVLISALFKGNLVTLFEKLKATNEITRHDYLITQIRVIATYLRLLFFPVNQTIDHQYKVYTDVFAPEIVASLALIAFLVAAATYLYRVSREQSPYLRLASFGIAWFFVTLSVESSIIPIIDVMFEHRLYLPGIGAILAVTALCFHLMEKMVLYRTIVQTAATCSLILIVATFSYAAHARNRVWQNELTLWNDVIAKKPGNPRGYNMVGSYYLANFRIYDAISYFKKALEVDSSYAEARSNLGNAYIMTGRIDEGLNELMFTAANNRFDAIDTGILYYNIAKGFLRKGRPDEAIKNLNIAMRLIPDEPAVYVMLGEVFEQKNLPEQSSVYFKRAHDLDPGRY